MRTAYAVAFSGDRFLMVWHSRRNGWEMPGGHVEEGETSAQAAAREFLEEAGYEVEILETRDIGYCDVCAAVLGRKVRDDCEMESRLFSELPEQLSFDREEYLDTIPWAKSVVDSRVGTPSRRWVTLVRAPIRPFKYSIRIASLSLAA